jgi:hypothetical protein
MPLTYTPIATTNGTGSSSSITFSSIPATYTDLRIVVSNAALVSGSDANLIFRINNDTASNYSLTNLGARALSSTPFSSRQSVAYGMANWFTAIATQQGMSQIDFMNYSNTTTFKTVLCNSRVNEGNATYSGVEVLVNLWRSTAAINSIKIETFNGSNLTTGSTFSLYGILAA